MGSGFSGDWLVGRCFQAVTSPRVAVSATTATYTPYHNQTMATERSLYPGS